MSKVPCSKHLNERVEDDELIGMANTYAGGIHLTDRRPGVPAMGRRHSAGGSGQFGFGRYPGGIGAPDRPAYHAGSGRLAP